jgi:MFS family permease
MRKLQCCFRIITCYLWVATRLSTGFSPTSSYSVHHSLSPSNMSRSTGSSVYRSVASLRGGSLPLMEARHSNNKSPSSSLDTSSASASDSEILYQRRGMNIALAAAYFTVMGAKCALPSVLAMLTSPDTGLTFAASWNMSPQQLVARQLTLSTLAIALGKVLLGPVIDHFGGVLSLQVALSTLAVLLSIIAASQPFMLFAVCWVMVDFIFSSCWAASINAIHQSFPAKEWSQQIASLAAAARAGNAIAFSLFASVLLFFDPRMRQSWRPVFVVAAVSQVIPLFLLSKFGKPLLRKQQQGGQQQQSSSSTTATVEAVRKRSSMGSSLATLRREASTPEFWLHLASRSSLMVFASFLLFVPTLMSQVYGASPAFAAQSGSIYALGCLLSITTISQVYSKLSRKSKIGSIIALLGTATLSSLAQLGHVAGMWHLSATTSAAFLFLWGFAFSVPFYIPPSLYALSRGGTESSATIADVFDIGGFTLLAAFNGYVAGIAHATPAAWIPTFQITTGCSVIALIALSLAVRLE